MKCYMNVFNIFDHRIFSMRMEYSYNVLSGYKTVYKIQFY